MGATSTLSRSADRRPGNLAATWANRVSHRPAPIVVRVTRRQEAQSRARRFLTTAVLAAVVVPAASTVASPAEAAIPAVAKTWSRLMFGSLTVTATGAGMRRTLATQRATVTTRTAGVTKATAALTAAQKAATTASASDTAAKARVTAARQAVTTAKTNLAKAKQRSKAAATRARAALTDAQRTLTLRTSQARTAATALTTANASAATAGTSLNSANVALKSASAAVETSKQKIAALPTPASLAARAAAVSKDVVTAVRPTFVPSETRIVYGTRVHWNVAYSYKRMVDDAAKAGIPLSGGGFRTKQRQIELRKINGCPDVWTAPASSCRVPTAIPGRSLHEIGMAIDITSGGRSLTSKSPGFKWLRAHAAEYGFKNLPSEPWHWSITGG